MAPGDTLDQVQEALLDLDEARFRQLIESAGTGEVLPSHFDEWILPALTRMGDDWERGEVSLAQIYLAGRIVESAMGDWFSSDRGMAASGSGGPRIVTVLFEDEHRLGLRMVQSVLRGRGWPFTDWGTQSAANLLTRIEQDPPDVLLISTLMLHSAQHLRPVLAEAFESHPRLRVVVGGAPFRLDPELGSRIGATAVGQRATDVIGILTGWFPATTSPTDRTAAPGIPEGGEGT